MPAQSAALLWSDVLRSLLAACHASFSPSSLNYPGGSGLLRAKLLLLLFRLLLDDRVSADFLFRCEAATLRLCQMEPASPTAPSECLS